MNCGTTIRSPQGVMRSISNCFRRLHLTKWSRTGVHGPTEVHYHHSTTLPAQEDKSKSTCEERKPLSDFTVAFENSSQGGISAKRLKLRVQILFQVT